MEKREEVPFLLEDTQPFEVGKHIIGAKVGCDGWVEVEKLMKLGRKEDWIF